MDAKRPRKASLTQTEDAMPGPVPAAVSYHVGLDLGLVGQSTGLAVIEKHGTRDGIVFALLCKSARKCIRRAAIRCQAFHKNPCNALGGCSMKAIHSDHGMTRLLA